MDGNAAERDDWKPFLAELTRGRGAVELREELLAVDLVGGQARLNDWVVCGQDEGIAKELLAVSTAESIVVGAEAALEESAEGP